MEQKAPGCFGAASVYSVDSAVCKGCVAYQACGDAALATLEAIKTVIDVRDLLKKHAVARAKASPTPPPTPAPLVKSPLPVAQPAVGAPIARTTAQEKVTFALTTEMQATIARIATQNKKAAEQATSLCRAGRINLLRAMLPQGINPLDESGPAYLRVVCDALLSGGFTRAGMRVTLAQRLGWTEESAASHISQAIAILGAFRIAAKDGDKIVLHPGLRCNNT